VRTANTFHAGHHSDGVVSMRTSESTLELEFASELEEEGTLIPVTPCKPEPGEIAASHTEAGILTKKVEITNKGVLVTDFGIDWRSVKARAKRELAPLIRRLETDPNITEIRIYGFSDCITWMGGPNTRYQTWLRTERARRVRDLLGPVARAKVKFVGPAPLDANNGPNTDRAGRARNRSVLIQYVTKIDYPPDVVTGKPCHEQLMRRALSQLRDDQNLDAQIKTRLGAALATSLAGRDDSFIRPGSTTSWIFAFHWSAIADYFRGLCNQPGGARALSAASLGRKLMELDQDIINGLDAFKRANQQFSGMQKAALDSNFGLRLKALLKNKAQTVYAKY
jgi:outer membrane protein OmpA-like peptidoglycan-associated protein